MNDDLSDIVDFYNSELEHEHTRLERHQLEYELTWRYLERYLPERGSILEIGAATGVYTVELARRGYQVTAVDMTEKLLQRCRENLSAHGMQNQARLVIADVRQLDQFVADEYDAALLMGPLYHLVLEVDRKTALGQVYERLRPGGLIFSAFISRYGILGDLMKKMPEWIENQAEVWSVLELGRDPENPRKGAFRGYFADPAEVAPLHESAGFETLVLAAVEPAISADDESYNQLYGARRRLWLDLLYKISAQPSSLGASRHLLYIGKKPITG
jgi:SAM-dependent methyltransferase